MRKAILIVLTIALAGCEVVSERHTYCELTVAISPPGAGTVTATDENGNPAVFPLTGMEIPEHHTRTGMLLSLKPNASAGFRFSHWEGYIEDTEKEISIRMMEDTSLTAVFEAVLSTQITQPSEDQVTIEEGQSVSFAGSATSGSPPYTYNWNFGASGLNPDTNNAPGVKLFSQAGSFVVTLTVTDGNSDQATDTVMVTVTAPIVLEDGLTSVGNTKLEGSQVLIDVNWAGMTTSHLLLVSGYDGILGLNLATGEELLTDFYQPASAVLGVIGLNASAAPETANYRDVLVEYGNDGLRFMPYDAADSQWGPPQWMISMAQVPDAIPFNGDPGSGGFVYVIYGQVAFVTYDELLDKWDFDHTFHMSSFPDMWSGFASAFARDETGTFLAVEAGYPGKLYMHNRTAAVVIGNVGNEPRKIRVLDEVGAVTNFYDDSITLISWDTSDNCAVLETVSVGDGPIGLDLIGLDSGNIAIVTTGYIDDTFTITEVTASGGLVSSDTQPVTTGCTQPGHAVWIRDGSLKVMISGSDNVAVMSSGL
jgi:hypothetical protein